LYAKGYALINTDSPQHHLLHKANQMSATIYEQTEAIHIKKRQNDLICYTKTGNQIVAKNIIMATGYEALFGKKEKNTAVETSYAVVTNKVDSFDLLYAKGYALINTDSPQHHLAYITLLVL
ncbi:hypothetical protein ACT453_32945, partial [Bacillus sp. D-CC]